MADEELTEPCVKITRTGRWLYSVAVHHDMMIWGPGGYGWIAFGRRHAEWLGDRKLRKYIRREAWRSS